MLPEVKFDLLANVRIHDEETWPFPDAVGLRRTFLWNCLFVWWVVVVVGGGSRQPEVAAARLMGRAPELDLFHYRGRAYLSNTNTDVFCLKKLTVPSVSFSSSVTKL